MAATLANHPISSAVVHLPRVGIWTAEVSLIDAVELSGSVSLVIDDVTLAGTLLRGGPSDGAASFFVIGGTGGWRSTISEKPYDNDLGIKLSTVLQHAADAAKEPI